MRPIKIRQPNINLLRPFFAGGKGCACIGGTAGAGAVIVGASICLPQLRQNASPGAAAAPHCGQTVAFKVGSLIGSPQRLITKSPALRCKRKIDLRRKCFYRENQGKSTNFWMTPELRGVSVPA